MMALFGRDAPLALSAVVHKYGDVFSGRTEFRFPSFDALRTGFEPARSPFETPLWGSSARTESSLRDSPSGFLRLNGRGETRFRWMTSRRTTDRTKKARAERRAMGWSRHRPCQAVAGWMLMLAR